MPDPFRLSRRAALAGAATLPLIARRASAEEAMVIATWGGDYANLLHANVDEPILKPEGIAG